MEFHLSEPPEPPQRKTVTKGEALNRLEQSFFKNDFDGTENFVFHNVGGYAYEYLPMFFYEEHNIVGPEHLGLSICVIDNTPYLQLWSICSEIRLEKGDALTLVFENSQIIEFSFHKEGRGKEIRCLKVELFDELSLLSDQLLDKWQYKNRHFEVCGDNTLFCQNCDIPDRETARLLLRKMAQRVKMVLESRYHSFEEV